jgi:cytochrome o ubiquinol oxidase subunit 2
MMNKKYKYALLILLVLGFVALAVWYLHSTNIPVLEPKGMVGQKERQLIYMALSLSLIVVIPVFVLLFAFAWKYRESNHVAKYSPDLAGSRAAETVWWLIPGVLILVLSVITWNSSHALDPYKSIDSATKPITIQVVALDWKWLFIYPQQNIASVNFVQFSKNTPVNFEITSDTVMNSFWIPQLGGQIYAMPGMSTELHLIANQNGSFNGSSANISGSGFAGMRFVAKASSQADFNAWVQSVKRSSNHLSMAAYNKLAQPSRNNKIAYYSGGQAGLYNTIMMKYMMPAGRQSNMPSDAQSQSIPGMQSMEMQ